MGGGWEEKKKKKKIGQGNINVKLKEIHQISL